MPEKLILTQVVPSIVWSTVRAGTDGHSLGEAQCEGWMDLGDQDLPTGCHISRPTADKASAVSHPE